MVIGFIGWWLIWAMIAIVMNAIAVLESLRERFNNFKNPYEI